MKWASKDILLSSFKRIITTIAVILIILALIFIVTISYLVGDSLVHPLIRTVLFVSTSLKSHHISDNV
ncbi:hypothetical protein J5Y03_04035 [Bacillus sp. RG28]|uniref:Uncharacterized protein n=1 Tax=Gottfriedia endophytica TaxID=2820819 RepID=A0A940SIZ2_9BACI|nr:hypothetical protein [Gottfriedia endophytica]MBP0724354.1 hypothetical protein [Gottfriedia endophytica]